MPQPKIQFPCHCGHRFSVSAEMAAGVIQCPKCGRLNDIPTLSDLENISEDGTLRLKADETKPEPDRIAQVNRAFRPGRIDDHGEEIDLRPTHQDLAQINSAEIPFADAPGPGVRQAKPKYDPITGELIRPLEVAKPTEPSGHEIPLAKRSLTYAAGEAKNVLTPAKIFIKMFEPANVIVMVFVFMFYILFQIAEIFTLKLFMMIQVPSVVVNFPLAFLLMGHYVNTVDENGPQMMDELPRPLRGLSWVDDIWGPFFRMAVALIICFAPAYFLLHRLPPQFLAVVLIPTILGFFLFPAVLLTMATSGTFVNLRPDRLMGVVRAAGGGYLLSFVLWGVALPLFAFSLCNVYLFPANWHDDYAWVRYLNKPYVGFPMLFLGIMLMHFASWHLGLLYQRHHAHFPWAYQRHISKRQLEEAKVAAQVRALSKKRRLATPSPPPAQ